MDWLSSENPESGAAILAPTQLLHLSGPRASAVQLVASTANATSVGFACGRVL